MIAPEFRCDDWQPTSTLADALDPNVTTYINVRTTTTYRWKPYKPDGQRQMKARGRWQRAQEPDGWENCSAPAGEWIPNPPKDFT